MLFGVQLRGITPSRKSLISEGKGRRRSWGRRRRPLKLTYSIYKLINYFKRNKNYIYSKNIHKFRFFFKLAKTFRWYFYYRIWRNFIFKFGYKRMYSLSKVFYKTDLVFYKRKLIGNWPRNSIKTSRWFINKISNYNNYLNLNKQVTVWPLNSSFFLNLDFNLQFKLDQKRSSKLRIFTLFLRGPKLFAQISLDKQNNIIIPLFVLTAVNTALLLNGERKHKFTPLVQVVFFTSIRRILIASHIFKFKLYFKGAIRGITNALKLLLTPQNEVFTNPISNKLMWDINLGPWKVLPTVQEFTEHVTKSVELTPDFNPNDEWVTAGIAELIKNGYLIKYKKLRFMYRVAIVKLTIKTGKNYSNKYSHLWRRKLRSLARRQTKRLVKQTQGRFWLGATI